MNKISDQIALGSKAFLITEYKYLAVFVTIVTICLFLLYFFMPPSGHWARWSSLLAVLFSGSISLCLSRLERNGYCYCKSCCWIIALRYITFLRLHALIIQVLLFLLHR